MSFLVGVLAVGAGVIGAVLHVVNITAGRGVEPSFWLLSALGALAYGGVGAVLARRSRVPRIPLVLGAIGLGQALALVCREYALLGAVPLDQFALAPAYEPAPVCGINRRREAGRARRLPGTWLNERSRMRRRRGWRQPARQTPLLRCPGLPARPRWRPSRRRFISLRLLRAKATAATEPGSCTRGIRTPIERRWSSASQRSRAALAPRHSPQGRPRR